MSVSDALPDVLLDPKVEGSPTDELAPRPTFRKGGTLPTAICLTKAQIGAGILSLAGHAGEVGLAYQLAGLAGGAVLSSASTRLVATASITTDCWSYEEISEQLFPIAVSYFTGSINTVNCLGAAAAYLVVVKDLFRVLTGASEVHGNTFVVLVGIFVCAPMSLGNRVSFMRYLAALSVVGLVYLVLVVVCIVAMQGIDESVTVRKLFLGAGDAGTFAYMNCFNNIVFAFCVQFNVPQLTGELTPAPTVGRMGRASGLGTAIAALLYSIVSIFGVLAFGVGKGQRDSLVQDLEPWRANPMVFVSLCMVMLSVLTCFQFHIFPIRQFAAFLFRQARGRREGGTDLVLCGLSLTRWLDMASSLASVAVIVYIAVAVPNLSTINDFIGAFASSYICFIIPPLWVIQIRRGQDRLILWSFETLSCIAMCCLGLVLFLFGTWAALA